MTLLPFTDCCVLLGVDPKTLRRWLTAAHLSCSPHPRDARLTCLTPAQLHHLATLHDRFLPDPLPGEAGEQGASPLAPASSSQPRPTTQVAPSPCEEDWRHQLALLQERVATLQEQVTHLALALVREQQLRWEARAPLSAPSPAALPPTTPLAPGHPVACTPTASAHPKPPRRTRALALIEERVDGQFVIIAPTQGVLALIPDSPAWFDWLSSLTSFTFQSQHGHFCATRKFRNGQRIQSWNVHRSLHGRSCTIYLGLTPTLTLARLQEMAIAVQARLS